VHIFPSCSNEFVQNQSDRIQQWAFHFLLKIWQLNLSFSMMPLRNLEVTALVLFSTIFSVFAHTALVWPQPRNPDPGIKGPYPCGNQSFWEPGAPITNLKPGVNTIYLVERIFHSGAPYRLALSPMDDSHFNDYVLLDHIPHFDNFTGYSWDNGKPWAVNITIPDIDCPRCALQMLNLMTDKLAYAGASCCTYPLAPSGVEVAPGTVKCFSVYHSCANVRILGKTPIGSYQHKYKGPCGPYGPEEGNTEWGMVGKAFMMRNPNYAPSIINTCPGFQRSCN
jgi:hypothetical protein